MPDWKKYSILVVDDSAVQREFAVALLQELGFEKIQQADNGDSAVKALQSCPAPGFDFMLTDLDMPGLDGVELLQETARQRWARFLIVMSAREAGILDAVEGMASEDQSIRLLSVLPKPLTRASLEKALRGADLDEDGHIAKNQYSGSFTLEEIRLGMERDEFVPYYQPKVDIATGLLRSAEALARWKHPARGLVKPAQFVPQLENSEFMWPFTLQMLKMVLADLSGWVSKGLSVGVAVNLSADALLDMTLADTLEDMARKAKVPAHLLILEVTETMVMKNLAASIGNLARLRLKGFSLSMDDYGIGYSSVQQLSRCPFTELKIDRSFVDGAVDHPSRRVILESSIQMGKRLGVTTIAEGVENEADWKLLQELGCDIGQGFYVSEPMPADELISWIKTRKKH